MEVVPEEEQPRHIETVPEQPEPLNRPSKKFSITNCILFYFYILHDDTVLEKKPHFRDVIQQFLCSCSHSRQTKSQLLYYISMLHQSLSNILWHHCAWILLDQEDAVVLTTRLKCSSSIQSHVITSLPVIQIHGTKPDLYVTHPQLVMNRCHSLPQRVRGVLSIITHHLRNLMWVQNILISNKGDVYSLWATVLFVHF